MGLANFILSDGSLRSVDIPFGGTLAEFARKNNIPGIPAECGCNLACGTCHVYVAEEWLPCLPPCSSVEQELLNGAIARDAVRSRLSCRLVMSKTLEGITVQVPDEQ